MATSKNCVWELELLSTRPSTVTNKHTKYRLFCSEYVVVHKLRLYIKQRNKKRWILNMKHFARCLCVNSVLLFESFDIYFCLFICFLEVFFFSFFFFLSFFALIPIKSGLICYSTYVLLLFSVLLLSLLRCFLFGFVRFC